jgi:hypothetical protein
MLKGLGNLEDAILSSLFGVISSKREDMENKWKNTQKLKKIKKKKKKKKKNRTEERGVW